MKNKIKKILIIISIIIIVVGLIKGIYVIKVIGNSSDVYIDGANAKGLFDILSVIMAIGIVFHSVKVVLILWIVYAIAIWLKWLKKKIKNKKSEL